ncbi:SMP-30/gluconolactonase/LRE family protein [Marimonas arenosa]|uniref:SMP-30/gluconolactonase/LRE family protein n=1 Tax=Marimonas arenosa TaxID=1795305 RepID=A0AAE3W9M2_9RHOB|nr:SMP-30/gluconolactonase/LRE family protein [Marimonas arenosa]MDQ2088901.1 SMP-30/gluconolactonase/LRE family protein [Marimonas arenosa]
MQVFDSTPCDLGEGPLWHPRRNQLFWFDINAHRLHTRSDEGIRMWQFAEFVSAAGWVSDTELLVASETALLRFDIETGAHSCLCPLEADNATTRSNDGRADPQGGFWISTMGKEKEKEAGAIYRLYKGELKQLFPAITIPNAICFAPDGTCAYFADTPRGKIWRQPLDTHGWPDGAPQLLLDLPAGSHRPDGAVVDAGGDLWIAHYGHGKVTRHAPDGTEKATFALPASRTTCPAFGGTDLTTLYVTTARQQMVAPTEADGCTYALETDTFGQPEHRVIL